MTIIIEDDVLITTVQSADQHGLTLFSLCRPGPAFISLGTMEHDRQISAATVISKDNRNVIRCITEKVHESSDKSLILHKTMCTMSRLI